MVTTQQTRQQTASVVAEVVDQKPQTTTIERVPVPERTSEPDAGRIVAVRPREENLGPKGYQGAGKLRLTKSEERALMAPFKDDEHDIKPTAFGEVYVGHHHYRRRLNEVIGQGRWCLIPVEFGGGALYLHDRVNEAVYSRLRLFIHGCFAAEAIGEQRWDAKNANMTYASACEGAKSDALVRCCKDLSIGWRCWDRRSTEAWRKKYAVRVVVKEKGGEIKYKWRLKDADPLPGEQRSGAAEGSLAPLDSGEPRATKGQIADLWALATEVYGRREATDRLYEVMKRHGYERAPDIAASAYKAIVAEVEKARGDAQR